MLTACAPTAVPDAAPTAGTVTVVTIGDSIMAGYGLDPSTAWPALLASETGADVANLACSGAGFATPGSCGTDFGGLLEQATALRPRYVILQSSSNDEGVSTQTLEDATTATVEAVHQDLPGATIVGLSTIWKDADSAPEVVQVSSDALRTAVDAVGGVYIDLGQPLSSTGDLMQADQIHPTAEGQQDLSTAIGAALTAHGIDLTG